MNTTRICKSFFAAALLIPNMMATPLFAQASAPAAPVSSDGNRVKASPLARKIAAEKGVFDLVDAWARIEGTARLLFVGGGPDRARLESRIAELGLTSRVDFAGLVPRSEMAAYYGGMDALVIPSLSTPSWKEQFGVVLAEAMLMGVPVVGSNSGAIPEVIGDAGLIFPEGDVSALVTCLNVLRMNLVRRRDFSMRGLARAQALYTPKAMAAQLMEIFSNMGAT